MSVPSLEAVIDLYPWKPSLALFRALEWHSGVFIATVPSGHWKSLYCWNRLFSSLGMQRLGRRIVDAHDHQMAHYNLLGPGEWAIALKKAGPRPVAFDPYLGPRGARFTTFVESVWALPFPMPGFFKPSGTFYFLAGVLRRIVGKRFWKRVILRWPRPLYEEPIGPDGVAAGLVVVARKEA